MLCDLFRPGQMDNAHEVYRRLADSGVVVRYRGSELHCENCLRISIGTAEENQKLEELLKETVAAMSGMTV